MIPQRKCCRCLEVPARRRITCTNACVKIQTLHQELRGASNPPTLHESAIYTKHRRSMATPPPSPRTLLARSVFSAFRFLTLESTTMFDRVAVKTSCSWLTRRQHAFLVVTISYTIRLPHLVLNSLWVHGFRPTLPSARRFNIYLVDFVDLGEIPHALSRTFCSATTKDRTVYRLQESNLPEYSSFSVDKTWGIYCTTL